MTTKPKESSIKKDVESAMKVAEDEQKEKLTQQRMNLAQSGIQAYRNQKVLEAVKLFQAYISSLEFSKNVPEGCLSPSHFKMPEELLDLMTLSGVYWELVTIYDRTNTQERYLDFVKYMEKFILFSKGMPYQSLCGETLRKYMRNEKTIHKSEFKKAYEFFGESQCFIASSLVDLIEESTLSDLRIFRDQFLTKNAWGRVFIYYYKKYSPYVAKKLNEQPQWLRKKIARILDFFAKWLSYKKSFSK